MPLSPRRARVSGRNSRPTRAQPGRVTAWRDDVPAPAATAAVGSLLEVVLGELAEDAPGAAAREVATRLTAVCRGNTALPVFPAAARELDRLLRAPRPMMPEILRVVRTDPELVRRVMTLASSAVFAHGVSDVDEAVVRIGLDRLWRAAMQSLVGATMFRVGDLQPVADAVREDGVRVADLASRLAPAGRTGEAYLAGLLHQIGTLTIFRFVPRTVDAEMARFVEGLRRECQSAIGVLVATHWGLAPATIEGIADHGRPQPASEIGKLVRAARIALAAQGEERPDTVTALAALGVDPRTTLEAAALLSV